jgi:hypothetical protein
VPLTSDRVVEQAAILRRYHEAEKLQLDEIRSYWKGQQALPAVIPAASPREMRTMAKIARVNVCSIVVDTLAQSTFVDGYRTEQDDEDAAVWSIWQANRMDARQSGIHRAAFAYGTSYAVVLPGDPVPVIRGVSPRNMTAVYGEDQDWPMWALERLGAGLWRLYDDEAAYYIADKPTVPGHLKSNQGFEFIETREHGLGVTPVVRFLDEDDLDADNDITTDTMTRGQIAPLLPLQDQIDLTTFGLLVAQWYSAFRQRWIIGWTADSETDKLNVGASRIMTFDRNPDEMKVGEFDQTDLKGYIESREASLRHAATLSQTPVHELIGELVNLSAEALAAAEAGRDRKVGERKTLLGEAHEQMFWLLGQIANVEVPDDAQVVWRDTSARAFAATVDGLGKLAQMLGIPPQELWERVPGATRQDVERWKAAAENGDSFQVLADMLERQAATPPATNGAVPGAF